MFLPSDYEEKRLILMKKTARQHFRELRKRISAESRCLLDSALLANIANLDCYKNAGTLLMYYPFNGEPNILPLARHALSVGKTVAFPISHVETNTLTFHAVSRLEDMEYGEYGIREPSFEQPQITEFSGSMCIVPALAFDYFGYRLGYGKGYFDRFLEQYDGFSVGLIYSYSLSELLPRDTYDRKVDLIITEKGEMLPCEEEKKDSE